MSTSSEASTEMPWVQLIDMDSTTVPVCSTKTTSTILLLRTADTEVRWEVRCKEVLAKRFSVSSYVSITLMLISNMGNTGTHCSIVFGWRGRRKSSSY